MCETITVLNNISTKNPFGLIYLATNSINGKVYVGKVALPRTIKTRWLEHLSEGRIVKRLRTGNPDEKIYSSHLNNAIAKYSELVWKLERIDIAYSEDELNEKETFWITSYDSMNREKGYNMTSGGDGMIHARREEIAKKLSISIKRKYDEDEDYKKKILEANKKGLNAIKKKYEENPEFEASVRKKIAKKQRDPKVREKKSESMKKKHREDLDYKRAQLERLQKARKIYEKLYKENSEFRNKIINGNVERGKMRRKEITNVEQFLLDIRSGKALKTLAIELNMSENSITTRIKEILGEFGVNNYTEAKKFLQDRDVKELMEAMD